MRTAGREVGANAATECKVVTAVAFIAVGVILDNERTGAANEEQPHHFAPVVGVEALLKSSKTGKRCVRIFQAELGFADFFKHVIGTNADVFLFVNEKAKLIRQV